MINVERIDRILRVLAISGAVKNGRGAMSAQLIAPSDAGKTQLLLRNIPRDARVINDFTFASLVSILNEKPRPPKWIVVPDFNTAISHKPSVATLTMSLLLPLLGEGVTEIPGIDGHAKLVAAMRRAKARGTTLAMLTGMTPQMFFSKRGKWRDTGLLRRLIPINYSYSKDTQRKIQTMIREGGDQIAYEHVRNKGPRVPVMIDLPSDIGKDLERLSETVTENQLSWKRGTEGDSTQALEFPFSVQKTLRTYARSHALLHDRGTVRQADLKGTLDFAAFMRYDRPEKI